MTRTGLAFIIAFTLAACASSPASKGLITTPSGLQYEITRNGTGPLAQPGQRVVAHYTGTLPDGTVFDSSLARQKPFSFVLGQARVIKGWDEAFRLLRAGDKATLTIPPHLAYGDKTRGKIPPNSTLRFEVELLALSDAAASSQ